MQQQQKYLGRKWEFITSAIASSSTGSLFLILLLSVPVDTLSYYLILAMSLILICCSPILLVIALKRSLLASERAETVLKIIRFPLYLGMIISMIRNILGATDLLSHNNWVQTVYFYFVSATSLLLGVVLLVFVLQLLLAKLQTRRILRRRRL